jgi:hypothetical protein
MQSAIFLEPFDRCDLFSNDTLYGSNAGTSWSSIDENGARTTLSLAAPVFRAGETQFITKDTQKSTFRIRFDLLFVPIDLELYVLRHEVLYRTRIDKVQL